MKSKYLSYDLPFASPSARLLQLRGVPRKGVDVVGRNRSVKLKGELRQVPTESIRLSAFNARRALDGKSFNELSSSIEQHGLIEPVVLRPQGGAYEVRDPDPVLFLEPKRVYRAIVEEVPEDNYVVPLGKAKIVREGTDVSLISWGAMLRQSAEAAERVKDKISVEIVDLRTLSPIDTATISKSIEKTGRAVVVHEAPRTSGLGAEVTAIINEKTFLSLKAPIERVTGFDVPFPLYKLENYYLPNADRIVRAIEKVTNF